MEYHFFEKSKQRILGAQNFALKCLWNIGFWEMEEVFGIVQVSSLVL